MAGLTRTALLLTGRECKCYLTMQVETIEALTATREGRKERKKGGRRNESQDIVAISYVSGDLQGNHFSDHSLSTWRSGHRKQSEVFQSGTF